MEDKKSLISTISLIAIIILTIIFIVIILKTGGKAIEIDSSVDITNGVTYDKQVALTINSNLRAYMDSEMTYSSIQTLVNVAKTNNRDADTNSDYKKVYFKYNEQIVSPDDLLSLIKDGEKYSAQTSNNDKSNVVTDDSSYYENGQIKLIEIKKI